MLEKAENILRKIYYRIERLANPLLLSTAKPDLGRSIIELKDLILCGVNSFGLFKKIYYRIESEPQPP